jgi:membrane fusion protein
LLHKVHAFVSDLFRKEAIHHATRRLAGEVVLASSLPSRVLAGLAILVVLGGTAFAATASYARKETVVGWLTPQAGMIRLAARQGGVVSAIHVKEGDRVVAGQAIATLTLSAALESGDSYAALSRSLEAQGSAAEAKAAAALAALAAEQRQLSDRRAALNRELVETRRRMALQSERLALAKAEVARAETITAQGFLPRRELDARRSAALAIDQESSELSAQILTYEREIGEVTARLAAIPIDVRLAQADATSTQAGLEQQATQTEALATYVVLATVAGRVAALPVDTGQTVLPGAVVAVVTAGNSRLEAELYAPSRAAGFVREGQEVRLLYQAFPHQKFGTGAGVVTSVSRTVLAPSEVAIPGVSVQEPVFRVRVALAKDSVSAYGETLPLQPGMLLSADVVIDRRSLLEWLLDPLYAAGRRG